MAANDELIQRANKLDTDYSARASRYDAHVVQQRGKATKLEITLAILTALVGMSSVGGLFSAISNVKIDHDAGVWAYIAAVWGMLPALLSIAAAVITGYLGAAQPRQKQAAFGANSAACAIMATAARVVSNAELSEMGDFKTAINAVFTTLQASIDPSLVPLDEPTSKKTV